MRTVFAKTLVREQQVRSFEVASRPGMGWEASERVDPDQIQQRHQYSDWHRVERTITRFTRQISELRRDGWIDA